MLVNKDFIRKSLVWPHQIDLCLEIMLLEFSGLPMQKVTKALGEAYENSIPNLEKLLPEGRTAIVYDTSASMEGAWGNKGVYLGNNDRSNAKPIDKATLVAATFAKGVCGDVYHFANDCERVTGWNPNDSVNTLKNHFKTYIGKRGHGTSCGSCFDEFV